jgi:2-deoxy-D-gluconate 3-dehydrogenase
VSFDPAAFRLDGRRALVTGGAAGIGAAIACGLAASGADVAVTVNRRAADDVLAGIAAHGRRGVALPADLARLDAAGAAALVATCVDRLGGLDVLVNNAGIIHRAAAVDHGEAEWRRLLQVNLDAAFLLSQAAGRRMAAAGFGRIVNVASVLGFQGGRFVAAYVASKHALVGLTRALCNEWAAAGVTVNALAPGYTVSENTAALRADDERAAALLARIPAGRWGEPDDMAGAAVFLASSAAAYVNGATLAVDGGWLSA